LEETIFSLHDVEYGYPGAAPVLLGLSFSVKAGESIAIIGANASGKSTLLHLLDGLYFPAKGQILAFGKELTEKNVETHPFARQFRQKVGFLFQNADSQLFCATVEEELAFGPLQLRLSEDELSRRVEDTMKLFGIENLRARSPQTLSGGEKKKVALASVIVCAPRMVLLDEPSAGLDPRTQQWLVEFMDILHGAGITLITASHDLSFVAETSERVLILSEDHRLVYDGPTKEALHNLELLLAVNLIHAHPHKHDGAVHMHPHLHEVWHEHEHHGVTPKPR
jgi:cobalt/nickel transport system ATP-binding protein